MERVVALRLVMFGPRHFLYADSMFALGHIIRKLGGKGADAKALGLMRDAITILEDAGACICMHGDDCVVNAYMTGVYGRSCT